jgi:hypothetical protein
VLQATPQRFASSVLSRVVEATPGAYDDGINGEPALA